MDASDLSSHSCVVKVDSYLNNPCSILYMYLGSCQKDIRPKLTEQTSDLTEWMSKPMNGEGGLY